MNFLHCLVLGLLDWETIQKGKFTRRLSEFSPQEVFDRILKLFELSAKFNKRLSWHVAGQEDQDKVISAIPKSIEWLPEDIIQLPHKLLGDELSLLQLLINLTKNALKFT